MSSLVGSWAHRFQEKLFYVPLWYHHWIELMYVHLNYDPS